MGRYYFEFHDLLHAKAHCRVPLLPVAATGQYRPRGGKGFQKSTIMYWNAIESVGGVTSTPPPTGRPKHKGDQRLRQTALKVKGYGRIGVKNGPLVMPPLLLTRVGRGAPFLEPATPPPLNSTSEPKTNAINPFVSCSALAKNGKSRAIAT